MDTVFLPAPFFATLTFVVVLSAFSERGRRLMGHSSLSGWGTNYLL